MKKYIILIVLFLVGCSTLSDDYNIAELKIRQISEKEVVEYFDDGTGIIIFAFPESEWCQQFMPLANDLGDSTTLYYFNVESIRERNTESYQSIYKEIKDFLSSNGYDPLLYEKIWVPTIVAVKNGEVLGVHVGTTDDHVKVSGVLPSLTDSQETEVKMDIIRIINKIK